MISPKIRIHYPFKTYVCLFIAIGFFLVFFFSYMYERGSSSHRFMVHIGSVMLSTILILNFGNATITLLSSRFAHIFTFSYLLCLTCSLMNFAIYRQDIEYITVSYIAFFAGLGLSFNPKYLRNALLLYFTLSILIAGYVVRYHLGGSFEIQDKYIGFWKNGLCAMLATNIAVSVLFTQRKQEHWLIRVAFAIIAIFSFFIIIYARARAAMLASILVSTYLFIIEFRISFLKIFFILVLLLFCFIFLGGFFISIQNVIWSSIVQGKDIHDLNSISSGRWDGFDFAAKLFFEYPLSGAGLTLNIDLSSIHNYLIRILSTYGIFFGGGFLIAWSALFVNSVIMLREWKGHLKNVAWVSIAVFMIISMFEHSVPFGSGTISSVVFFLLGTSFKQDDYM